MTNFFRIFLITIMFLILTGCCGEVRSYYLDKYSNIRGLTLSGFSQPEEFGRWSIEDQVVFTFDKDIPSNTILLLKINGTFGPNFGKTFRIQIANQSFEFEGPRQSDGVIPLKFELSNIPKGTRSISISIPSPASPKDLVNGNDDRRLGIGINSIHFLPMHANFACEYFGFYPR